ncbi:hypothetical protein HK098_004686, partial [Nowakowskiella sp. JEL0407]
MDTDSEKTAVKHLAGDVSANAQIKVKKGLLCEIPLGVVMLTLTIGIFSLAIIPTCVIVFSAAQTAAQELSTKIINSVVINLSSELTNIFTSVKHANDVFLSNPDVKFAMTNVTKGFELLDSVHNLAKVTIDNSPFTDRL